jgi:hypothetical protein
MSTNQNAVNLEKKLLISFDCTKEYGPEQYFGHEGVKVITYKGLTYRETGQIPSSRFGYRFQIDRIGHPHLVVVKYPHDKQRFMCVLDGTTYDLNTGLATGKVLPLTGKMEEINIIYWPRWTDCSITIMTYSHDEPAAAGSIEIYELASLPPLNRSNKSILPQSECRWIGMQFEDPCGGTASVGAKDHFQWTERVIDYAKFTGQNLLTYPLLWYHGPLFPSKVEIPDITEIWVAEDRKQYVQWSTKPFDWYKPLLKRFGEEGLSFIGGLTLLRLSTLMKQMNCDIESIRNGADTINNMVENNRVKNSTGDWTRIHHAENYEKIVAEIGPEDIVRGFSMPKDTPLAYNEKSYWGNRGGPIFNPLHPTVQKSILNFTEEIGENYKEYSAFKGISISVYASTFIWFGTLRYGYDDYTITLFEKETHIHVPVKPTDKKRFGKRYKFLVKKHKEAWINWRCEKIRDLLRKIRDKLQQIRSDYKLFITLWDETVFLPNLGIIGKKHQFGTRMSNYDFYREAGIDMKFYQNEPGIFLDLNVGCTRDRGGHSPDATAGKNIKVEHSSMYRDFDFLDERKNNAFASLNSPGVYNFNCWVESWGKYKWFQPREGDNNIEEAKMMDGVPVDGMIACNSLYPDDGFWWDSQLRIVPTYLAGDHYLEPFAHSLAEFDADRMTSGGLFLDSSHSTYTQKFARYFTALPAKKFEQVGEISDPIVIRSIVYNNIRYIYAINRECYNVKVKLAFNSPIKSGDSLKQSEIQLIDLASSNPLEVSVNNHSKDLISLFTLGPYELMAWTSNPILEPCKFQIEIDSDIIQDLEKSAQNALDLLKQHQKRKFGKIKGIEIISSIIKDCLEKKKYAKLRRALTSYVIRKVESLKNNG